jgi:hypothetical protein
MSNFLAKFILVLVLALGLFARIGAQQLPLEDSEPTAALAYLEDLSPLATDDLSATLLAPLQASEQENSEEVLADAATTPLEEDPSALSDEANIEQLAESLTFDPAAAAASSLEDDVDNFDLADTPVFESAIVTVAYDPQQLLSTRTLLGPNISSIRTTSTTTTSTTAATTTSTATPVSSLSSSRVNEMPSSMVAASLQQLASRLPFLSKQHNDHSSVQQQQQQSADDKPQCKEYLYQSPCGIFGTILQTVTDHCKPIKICKTFVGGPQQPHR